MTDKLGKEQKNVFCLNNVPCIRSFGPDSSLQFTFLGIVANIGLQLTLHYFTESVSQPEWLCIGIFKNCFFIIMMENQRNKASILEYKQIKVY